MEGTNELEDDAQTPAAPVHWHPKIHELSSLLGPQSHGVAMKVDAL